MKKRSPKRRTLSAEELEGIKKRAGERKFEESDYELVLAILETIETLRDAVQKKSTAVKRLLRSIFGPRTEKTEEVLADGEAQCLSGNSA
jgi:hypothetical protein